MSRNRILIIEDDEGIREGVRILLESEGYEVAEAGNGTDGLNLLDEQTDLLILDIMLPDISGLEVCEEVRRFSYVPILFLTAKAMESDKLTGLMAGGDDYLTKPFSYTELLGRVSALIRRYHTYNSVQSSDRETDRYITVDEIHINTISNEVYKNDTEVSLTELEYRILLMLARQPGKIFSAESIYENVWKETYTHCCNGTVLVHIRNLRVKLEDDPGNPKYIKTVWGKGYCVEKK
ncbi:MAG: response regulator transcription factor [Bacillota bacterium]|nr:response regulator transcription factor [Bacillota bacterium]